MNLREVQKAVIETEFQFTEKIRGFVSSGVMTYEDGYRRGAEDNSSLMFQLTIRTENIDVFIGNRDHEADAVVTLLARSTCSLDALPIDAYVIVDY